MKKNSAKIFSSGEHKLVSLAKFGAFIFTKPGLALIRKILRKKLGRKQNEVDGPTDYYSWLTNRAAQHPQSKDGPKFSILMNASDADTTLLNKAINSVIAQQYDNWELIIAGSNIKDVLSKVAQNDTRIREANTRSSIFTGHAMASGDYILYMRYDDVLASWALPVIAAYINAHPATDVLYADEDNMDRHGVTQTPYFKPGWSPDTLLSRNYIGHNIVVKRSLAARHADNTDSFYDLVLRLTEQAKHIAHIPLVLSRSTIPPFADTSDALAKKALADALARRGLQGIVNNVSGTSGCYHIHYTIAQSEKVSIIIPTKDNAELLQKTIDSILQKTGHHNYEIIVLNNNSTSSAFFKLMDGYTASYPGKFRCVEASFPFNFARLMNMGAELSSGTYLLMCNNDIEVLHADWMTQMVAQAQQAHTGAVGAKLLFPDDTIQHAGIALGSDEASEHIFAHRNREDDGYFFSLKAATNYAAVTAACLMCRKTFFEQVGGMDEALAVEYNDVDLCLKLLKAGYYNVLLPSVVLYHYESATRGHPFRSKASWQQHENELKIFLQRWKDIIENDPFFNDVQKQEFSYNTVAGR